MMKTKSDASRLHRIGVAAFPLMAMIFLGAPLLLWSWNTVASGLFQMPIMMFKHALAVELFLVVVCLISGTVLKFFMSGPGTAETGS